MAKAESIILKPPSDLEKNSIQRVNKNFVKRSLDTIDLRLIMEAVCTGTCDLNLLSSSVLRVI